MGQQRENSQKSTMQGQIFLQNQFLKNWLTKLHCIRFLIEKLCQIFKFKNQHNKLNVIYRIVSLKAYLLSYTNSQQLFLNHRSDSNLFSLNWQILLFTESSCSSSDRQWLSNEISRNLLISFEQLKSTQLSGREDDTELIKTIKRDYQYVYILMHQVMIRIILAYLEISQYEKITTKAESFGNQISFIYPALKAQISINESNINLTDWFQYYISKIIIDRQPNEAFYDFLDLIKEQSHFIGSMERLFNKFQESRVPESNGLYSREFDASICGQSRSQSINSRFSQSKGFCDLEILRKKKKIIKDRIRFQKMGFDNTTNTSVKIRQQKSSTPFAEELAEPLKNYQRQIVTSKNGNFDISKLLRKSKKPIQRTIYHSSIKTFIAKKPSNINLNPQQYIQNLTASSSLTSNQSLSFYDTCRRFSSNFATKNTAQYEESQFHVPETPKQQSYRKKSIQASRFALDSKSFMPRMRL